MKTNLVLIAVVSLIGSSALARSINVRCEFDFPSYNEKLEVALIVEPPKPSQGKVTHQGLVYWLNLGDIQPFEKVNQDVINSARLLHSFAELDWMKDPKSKHLMATIRGSYTLLAKDQSLLTLDFSAIMTSDNQVLRRSSTFNGPGRVIATVKPTIAVDPPQGVVPVRGDIAYGSVSCTNMTNSTLR